MKRAAVLVAIFLAGAFALAPASRTAGGAISLVRIPKAPASTLTVLARIGLDVRQELGTCLLAFADRTDLDLLRRGGVRFTVLERNAERREFLLVGASRAGDLESLRAAGRAVVLEPGATLFWTDAGPASEAVPAVLPRKALPSRSILPYLRPRRAGGLSEAPVSAQDPLVSTIVAHVSSASLGAGVQTLQDFQTRYASTTNCDAVAEALFASFTAQGLDEVRFEPFSYTGGRTSRNVVAEKTGRTYPDDIVIVCSHYDSISPSATRDSLAPGADDNASGTAAVLEAARVMAPYDFDFTVRFIAFSAEEWGLWGSRSHAAAARAAGERILGVVNLDMIAFTDVTPEDLQIIVNEDSAWLADLFTAAGPHYGFVSATKMVDPSIIYSDHSPFWDNGYPALLAIEDYPLDNPYYHQTTDTLDKLNLDFLTVSTRASVGLLAELAQPLRDGYPRTPAGLAAAPVVYSSLFNNLRAVRLTWTAQADAVGYNVYRSMSSHLGYVKLNPAPLAAPVCLDDAAAADGTYYYAVTAVGPTGLESNKSRELVLAPTTLRGAR